MNLRIMSTAAVGALTVLIAIPGTANAGLAAPRPAPADKPSLHELVSTWRTQARGTRPAPKPHGAPGAADGASILPAVTTACGDRSPVPTPPGGAPYETWSRYLNATDLYQMGYYQGCASDQQRGSSSTLDQVAILDFGDPGRGGDGRYGAWDGGGYHPIGSTGETNSIEWSVVQYMRGFWNGTVPGSGSYMTVLVGTNNHKYNDNGSDNGAPVNYAHGQAWARMVNDLNNWISNVGFGTQLRVQAANDMETSWAYYSQTLDWANGFASVGGAQYYNYGDAGGCPLTSSGNCYQGPFPNGGWAGWTTSNIYTLSWGLAPAYAMPEIYYSYEAQQWHQVSLAGVHAGGGRIYFTAGLSQHNACGCSNTYDQSWSQLQNAVNADSNTSIGRIPYTTEMSYANP